MRAMGVFAVADRAVLCFQARPGGPWTRFTLHSRLNFDGLLLFWLLLVTARVGQRPRYHEPPEPQITPVTKKFSKAKYAHNQRVGSVPTTDS